MFRGRPAAGAAAASNHLATPPREAAGGQSERAARLEAMADALTSFPDVPEVTVEQLRADLASGAAVLVDVRSPAEVAVSTFAADPPAVTVDEFDRDPARWAGRRVVCACTVGYRSRKKAQELRAAGVEAANLRGGILAWVRARRSGGAAAAGCWPGGMSGEGWRDGGQVPAWADACCSLLQGSTTTSPRAPPPTTPTVGRRTPACRSSTPLASKPNVCTCTHPAGRCKQRATRPSSFRHRCTSERSFWAKEPYGL